MRVRSNFEFLRDAWPTEYSHALEAERLARKTPAAAPNRARVAFEAAHLRYRGFDGAPRREERLSLRLFVRELRRELGPNNRICQAADALSEVANKHSHLSAAPATEVEAVEAIENLYLVLRRLYVTKHGRAAGSIPEFDPALVPSASLQRQRENLADGTLSVSSLADLCLGGMSQTQAAAAAAVLESLTDRFVALAERHTL